ncbi:MAG TPA: hypothetical protein VF066_10910 [Thermoleophilaceae bacterium]
MSDPTESTSTRALRGEAAWIAHRDAIQARNAETKKAGKARHDEWERLRTSNRRAVDAREEKRFIAAQEDH